MDAWNGNILQIDLAKRTHWIEKLAPDIYTNFIGGKGLGTYLLYRDLKPGTDPLGPENRLIFLTGPLQGLPMVMIGRWTLVTKSPLTGLFLDTHCGGPLGREIKNSGHDAIVISGNSESPVTVLVEDEDVRFEDANHLWGKGTQEATRLLHDSSPKNAAVYVIGPAGENLVLTATGCCELAHQTGRGGAGAVLGSKNLKGLVVKGNRKVSAADPAALGRMRKLISRRWDEIANDSFKDYGTAVIIETANERGQFPTRNWQNTYFEDYEKLTPEYTEKWITGNQLSCPHCIINCTHSYRTEDPTNPGIEVESTPEYETWGLCGGNLGISDAQAVFKLNYLVFKRLNVTS